MSVLRCLSFFERASRHGTRRAGTAAVHAFFPSVFDLVEASAHGRARSAAIDAFFVAVHLAVVALGAEARAWSSTIDALFGLSLDAVLAGRRPVAQGSNAAIVEQPGLVLPGQLARVATGAILGFLLGLAELFYPVNTSYNGLLVITGVPLLLISAAILIGAIITRDRVASENRRGSSAYAACLSPQWQLLVYWDWLLIRSENN